MVTLICTSCGVQHASSAQPPSFCRICADERQDQTPADPPWITPQDLAAHYRNRLAEVESGLFLLWTEPTFAIGQRAYFLRTPTGNVLWDCLSAVDAQTLEQLKEFGGIRAIALSHPHFYGSAVEWSAAFGGVPIYVHAADREWIQRPDPCFQLWTGERQEIIEGVTLLHCGGHFDGSAVLHWPEGAEGRGVLLASDTIYVCPDGRWVSFMYSYPNCIPLDEASVRQIRERVAAVRFDRIYGAFGAKVARDGQTVVEESAARYVSFLKGQRP